MNRGPVADRVQWIGFVVAFATMFLVAAVPEYWKPLVALSFSAWCLLLAGHVLARFPGTRERDTGHGFEVKPITGTVARAETKEDGHHG